MTPVHVAVGVVRLNRKVLVARRPEDSHQGGLLEFPGGKVEPGEEVRAALVRELHEELGIDVSYKHLRPLIQIPHDYGDKRVLLDVWEVLSFQGTPCGREGQPLFWLEPDALLDDTFPAANRPIIRALRLPGRYLVTGAFDSAEHCLVLLESALSRFSLPLVLLRAPEWSEVAYLDLADRCLSLCRTYGSQLMLHGAPHLLQDIPAAGIHLPWLEAEQWQERPVSSERWLAVSCHGREELEQAARLRADFVTLSPVAPTASHPDREPLGWEQFAALSQAATMPVYALGGMAEEDEDRARQLGAQGIAGIRLWW